MLHDAMNQGEPQPNALLLVRRAINLDERPQPMQVILVHSAPVIGDPRAVPTRFTASFHCNPIPPPLKT